MSPCPENEGTKGAKEQIPFSDRLVLHPTSVESFHMVRMLHFLLNNVPGLSSDPPRHWDSRAGGGGETTENIRQVEVSENSLFY
jgi:hypothetical protein